jgi:signal transduction histidine kinase
MLHDDVFGPLTDEQRQVAQDILEAGRHLQQLVNDTIDLHKIHARIMPLSLETLSVAQIAQQSMLALAPLASTRQCHVFDMVPPELAVTADERRLTQVICNLLQNAIHFSPEGASVQVTAERCGDFVRLAVIDNGHGIPPEEHERVFAPFVALDRESQPGGTGLGLPLSLGLVTMMGGALDLVSSPGAGSTFSFTLPAAVPPPQ